MIFDENFQDFQNFNDYFYLYFNLNLNDILKFSDFQTLTKQELTIDTQTDWLAAFGFKSDVMGSTATVTHYVKSDDDLGFDPFSESSKGLADLMLQEEEQNAKAQFHQQNQQRMSAFAAFSSAGGSQPMHHQQLQHQQQQPVSSMNSADYANHKLYGQQRQFNGMINPNATAFQPRPKEDVKLSA